MSGSNKISDNVGSKESLITAQQRQNDEIVLKVSELDCKPICRICYVGSSQERLLTPCKCKGTIQYVHRHCLERWLETKNFEACELCHHHFETRKTRKSCWAWLKQPETQSERRNFIGDFTCFAFLTPLGIATFWLCIEGAIYYQRVKNSTLETVALITLAVFLVVAYFTWIVLCTKYHVMMWNRWRNCNWNVRIVDRANTEGRLEATANTPVSLQNTQASSLPVWQSETRSSDLEELQATSRNEMPRILISNYCSDIHTGVSNV